MAKCYLHDIVDPDSSTITDAHWEQVFSIMRESSWYQPKGKRMGFVSLTRRNSMIGGYFANEGRKKGVQYDDNKEQLEPPPFYSFEHLFFILFEDTGQLLLQSRNIYDYIDLSLPDMRSNFLNLLTELLRSVNIYIAGKTIGLKSAGITYTQEQLYQTFTSIAKVIEIEISGLHQAELPLPDDPRYNLFNPKDEWNPITWGAVADTLESGLDHVTMSARESVESTLQSPIPKALAAVGSIEKIRGYDERGRVVYRERTEDAELEIELPIQPTVAPDVLDRIFERLDSRGRVDSWRERQRRRREMLAHGHMFGSLD